MLAETENLLEELVTIDRFKAALVRTSGTVEVHIDGSAPQQFFDSARPTYGSIDDLDSVALCPLESIPLALVTGALPHYHGGGLQYSLASQMWKDVLAPMLMHRLLKRTD